MPVGGLVGTVSNSPELSRAELANMMVGRPVTLKIDKTPAKRGDLVLKLENLCTAKDKRRSSLRGLSLGVHRGEIFGIAGVDGNGQSELAAAIMGLQNLTAGRISILGQDTTEWSTRQIRRLPLAYIPEDRQKVGLVMGFPVRDNLVLSDVEQPPFGTALRLEQSAMLKNARKMIARFKISTPGPMTLVEKLSGGNQQKVVAAREVGDDVDLIIAAQATRGLDVEATRFVMDSMVAARDRGAGVLYISTELEEILALCDTIAVLFEGQLVGVISAEEATVEKIGLWMAGDRAAA